MKPAKSETSAPTKNPYRNTQLSWNEIGDGFETLGKVGLAMAIGMSAAGIFCRLADQGKVRVPKLSSFILDPRAPESTGSGARQ